MKRLSIKGNKGNTLLCMAYLAPTIESLTLLLPETGRYIIDIREQQQNRNKINIAVVVYITSYKIDLRTLSPGQYQIKIIEPKTKQFAVYKVARQL